MNLRTAKKYILLEQSGELSVRRERKLKAFLRDSADARAFKETLWSITSASKTADPVVSCEHLTANILDHARRYRSAKPAAPAAVPLSAHRPVFALAAVLLLALGVAILLRSGTRPADRAEVPPHAGTAVDDDPADLDPALAWNGSFDEEISELARMLAQTSGQLQEPDLQDLANQLLTLEDS